MRACHFGVPPWSAFYMEMFAPNHRKENDFVPAEGHIER